MQQCIRLNFLPEPIKKRWAVLARRFDVDRSNILKPFTLMSHKQNYVLFAAHNFKTLESSCFEDFFEIDVTDHTTKECSNECE
ncbi:MAG: hypothetical protein D3903_17080 [Candidatus Electrothrix sp. GM3_4]|nr:hypothetical protein [Candidatus Electrothrix sp. GM3_4]